MTAGISPAVLERLLGTAPCPPEPRTSFVGRASEVAELERLLGRHRLVTVTGPGGVGKSRLAAEVARRVGDQFPAGVRFVDLSASTDTAGVIASIADSVGVTRAGGDPTLAAIAAAARERLLLVLDNCEQVLTVVAETCGILLTQASDLRILATSREQLWVAGEAQYRLRPLESPGTTEPGEARQSAAVDLFVQRATQVDRDFRLSPESAQLVSRLVGHLEGMPVAIEMAAARVKALRLARTEGLV